MKETNLRHVTGSRIYLYGWIQYSFYNSNRDTSLTASKDDFILINSLHLKFRSVNLLSKHKATIKTTSKNVCSEKFLQIITGSTVAEFIFSKVLCFPAYSSQHENYFLRGILFYTFKQHSGSCLKLQIPYFKNFQWWKHVKRWSYKSYLG